MQEPSLRTSRLAIAGGLAAAIVVGGGGFLLGRSTQERPVVAVAPRPTPVPVVAPSPTPLARAVLDRGDLIALSERAADAIAGGTDAGAQLAEAVGRRFEVRLPFGCDGPTAQDSVAAMRWRYDADTRTLRAQAVPMAWTAADWWQADAPPAEIAAIEGFWIARPWTTSEACPADSSRPAVTGAQAVTLPGQTLALGQVFLNEGPRQARRDGQPYQVTQRVAEGEIDTSQGMRLRLAGRIVALPGASGPVRCQQPAGPEQRPVCLIGVAFEQVALESGASGATIATWDIGGTTRAADGG